MNSSIVGNDAGEHNCKPSTGYAWSVLKQECIRPFELDFKFTNLKNSTQGGYLLFLDDKINVEYFGAGIKPSLVLSKTTTGSYESNNGVYQLAEDARKRWILNEKNSSGTHVPVEQDK